MLKFVVRLWGFFLSLFQDVVHYSCGTQQKHNISIAGIVVRPEQVQDNNDSRVILFLLGEWYRGSVEVGGSIGRKGGEGGVDA